MGDQINLNELISLAKLRQSSRQEYDKLMRNMEEVNIDIAKMTMRTMKNLKDFVVKELEDEKK